VPCPEGIQAILSLSLTTKKRWLLLGGLCAWPFFAWGVARFLIVRAPLDQAEAIVILSGSAAYRERIQEAAKLYKQGKAERLILTNDNRKGGWSQEKQRNPFFYEQELEELNRQGIPSQRIEVLMQPVSSTYDEALLLQRYAHEHQLKSLLIVTSPYHSRRAFWIFRHVANNPDLQIGIETVEFGSDEPRPISWWLRARGWFEVGGEYLKLVYYWILY